MMSHFLRRCQRCLLLLAFVAAQSAHAVPTAAVSAGATLPPDGRFLAMRVLSAGERQPARITAPLLMAHGYTDHMVYMSDARALYQAIAKTNAQTQWLEYGDEGHDWVLPATHVDFWQRVEQFLARHNAAATAGSTPP